VVPTEDRPQKPGAIHHLSLFQQLTCTAFSCQGFGAGRGVCLKSKQSAMPLDPLSRALR